MNRTYQLVSSYIAGPSFDIPQAGHGFPMSDKAITRALMNTVLPLRISLDHTPSKFKGRRFLSSKKYCFEATTSDPGVLAKLSSMSLVKASSRSR